MNPNLCEIDAVNWLIASCSTKYHHWLLQAVFDWQTLITGLVAGLPAAFGAWLLWSQINDQREETKRVRKQIEVGARIKMPHALSLLSDYWRQSFKAIIAEDLHQKTTHLPTDALEVVMAAAPSVDPKTFKTIQKLITDSQIFESRLRTAKEHSSKKMIPMLIIDVAHLDFYTDALYEYSRFEVDEIPHIKPDRDQLADQIYNNLDLHDRMCTTEAKKMIIESALNEEFPG